MQAQTENKQALEKQATQPGSPAAGPAGSPQKTFLATVAALVIPMALQNLVNVGVQSADVVMLGMVGEVALSASSLAGQVQFVMTLIFFGLASGASVLTAQYWGKGDTRAIEKILSIALRISVAVALVFMVAALSAPEFLMRIFTKDEAVISEGIRYLRVVAPSYLLIGFTNLYLIVMRSVERVVISTVVYFISFITNVVLNAVFIFGLLGVPAMGIVGAALATTLARIIEFAIVLVYALRNKTIRLKPKDYVTTHKVLTGDFIKYALPTTMNEMIWGLAIAMNSVIIGRLDTSAVAANSVAQVTRQLATVVSFGLANAAAILIGKALGAGRPDEAENIAKRMMRMGLVVGLSGAALILVIRPLVVNVMELSDLAKDYLGFLLLIVSAYVICQTFTAVTIVGIFRGGGDTKFGLYADTITMWCGSILLASLAAFVFKAPVKVVFLFIMCEEFIKLPLCLWRYKGRKWLQNVTRPAGVD